MARIRSIKPEFWTSEQVMNCRMMTRLLFIGMWNFADDQGRMPFSPRTIKAQVMPSDELSADDVRGMILELSTNGLVKLYAIDGKEYLEITGWHHQRIDKPRPAKHPGPSEKGAVPIQEPSENVPIASVDGWEGIGEDTKGEDQIRSNSRAVAGATRPKIDRFDEFWGAYPKRDGANPKEPARKKFNAALKSGADAGEIIAATKRYAVECADRKITATSYVAQSVTWLSQQRWGDYAPPTAPEGVVASLFWLSADDERFKAWEKHLGKPCPRDKNFGWRFPTEWPPGHQQVAAA